MATSRAFFVFSDSDAEYPDVEFARAIYLGKVGRWSLWECYMCTCVHVPYFALLYPREKSSTTCYLHVTYLDSRFKRCRYKVNLHGSYM